MFTGNLSLGLTVRLKQASGVIHTAVWYTQYIENSFKLTFQYNFSQSIYRLLPPCLLPVSSISVSFTSLSSTSLSSNFVSSTSFYLSVLFTSLSSSSLCDLPLCLPPPCLLSLSFKLLNDVWQFWMSYICFYLYQTT